MRSRPSKVANVQSKKGVGVAQDPQRKAAIGHRLSETSLGALVAFSPTHVLLLTGYCPVMGTSVAIFTRDGGVGAVVPNDELDLAKATSDAELIGYHPATLDELTTPARALIDPLRELCRKLDLSGVPLGTALHGSAQTASYLSTHRFRHSRAALLEQACPGTSLHSADTIFEELEAVKTPVELDQIRRACRLAAAGFDEAATIIKAGTREDQIAANIEARFSKVALDGFERADGTFFCMSGPHNSYEASGAYARTRRRTLESGDLVMIHANTCGDGYWTDITRTWVVGEPSPEQTRMTDAIAEARRAAFAQIRPGTAASAVDAAAREVLDNRGFGPNFKHSTGHGVGFAAADGNARPRIHPKSPDVLEAGMTFNIEPAIYIEGVGGMRHCDVVACTASGVELLTDF
jgi:Xaa-Pro aminopeptidase/Xaa-Pro dipeptidase